MKPRRVIVTMEVETSCPMREIRSRREWQSILDRFEDVVIQVQANVIREPKKRRK